MLGLFPHLDPYSPPRRLPLLVRLRRAWQTSLSFRLLALGLVAGLIGLPLLIALG